MSIPFGGVDLDPVEIGINGNAILGIKESGKSYLGTELGEIFFDADIPFVTFDPIGIWHNMRYPGRGKGFPIVVAGGYHGDMPLTPANATAIVEAAMMKGMSVVLDLFHPELSKRDWRTIVRECAMLLLHKNSRHGLRHVFIEEAAEFVPQKVTDGLVYDAVERLIRMGGNSRLGCTLISPRSQEVNKAVLELCENMFLFRQRGKNALENLKKWLDVAGAEGRDVMRTLPNMPRGECWAWLGGSDKPVHVKVPQKRSFHPDRRAMQGDVAAPRAKAVNVGKFVDALQAVLPTLEEEAKANDPKALRARIAELHRELAKKPGAATVTPTAPAYPDVRPQLNEALDNLEELRGWRNTLEAVWGKLSVSMVEALQRSVPLLPRDGKPITLPPPPPPMREVRENSVPPNPPTARQRPAAAAEPGDISGPRQLILDKIAWANVFFNDPAVEKAVLGFLVGKHERTKSFLNDLGGLKSAGLIDQLSGGRFALTTAGRQLAADSGTPDYAELLDGVKSSLTPRQGDILDRVIDGEPLEREHLAGDLGLHARTKSFLNDLGRMRSLGIIIYSGTALLPADFLRRR